MIFLKKKEDKEIKEGNKNRYPRATIPIDENKFIRFKNFIRERYTRDTGQTFINCCNKAFHLFEVEEMHGWIEKVEAINLHNIFTYRRNRNEMERIKMAYQEALWVDHSTVRIMGISLKDLFLPNYEYYDIIKDSVIEHNVSYKAIILKPLSPAAIFRIEIEQPGIEPSESQLFNDIYNVMMQLKNPSIRSEKDKKKFKEHIDVRFADETLSTYLMISNDFTLVENYHTGITSGIDEDDNIRDQICLGGYGVPYFMFRNRGSIFAKLMTSHFENLFKRYEKNTLENTLKEIKTYNSN